jgi:microcystin degradation protein MlrC
MYSAANAAKALRRNRPSRRSFQERLATAAGNVAEAESTPTFITGRNDKARRGGPGERNSAFNVIVQVILHIPALGVCLDPIALRVARAFRTNEKAPAMPGL